MSEEEVLFALGRLARNKEEYRDLDANEIKAISRRVMQARPVPISRARRYAAASLAAALAAAAAAVLVLPQSEPLPNYTLEITGLAQQRSAKEEAPIIELSKQMPLEMVVRPAVRVDGELEVRGVFVSGDRVVDWSPPITSQTNGVVLIRGAGADLPIEAGEWDLLVFVARRDQTPAIARARIRLLR